MEIWMINQYAITPDLPGGSRHYDFASELTRLGCTVKIFASDVNLALRRHTKLNEGVLYTIEDINGVEFIWVKSALYERNNWRRIWNMLSFAKNVHRVAGKVGKKPDVIIGSSPHPFAALAAKYIAKKLHARFLLELRDLWPQALIDMGEVSESHLGIKIMRLIEGNLYDGAEQIIVLAKGSIEYLEKGWAVKREKILYIPNGVYLENIYYRESRDTLRKRYKFDRFTIVYTGAHGPANALETIVRAAKRLLENENIEIVLLGDGPAKQDIIKQAENLNLTNLRFMDPIPKASIPELLLAADAGVITLLAADAFTYGISPNKLFDYMASHKPVVCAVAGDVGTLVETTGCGITVPPENDAALAQAILEMSLLDEKQRGKMGDNGYIEVINNYSRQKLAHRLLNSINHKSN